MRRPKPRPWRRAFADDRRRRAEVPTEQIDLDRVYAEFRERFPAHIHAIETKLASETLGYAGTLDRVMTMPDGRTLLIDIKTSGSVWPELLASTGRGPRTHPRHGIHRGDVP